MPHHQLIEIDERDTKYTCLVCNWLWTRKPTNYSTSCPGVPRYNWWGSADRNPPEQLLTKSQMYDAGFTTGKKLPAPAGAISRVDSPGGWLWLYDAAQGVPRRALTAAQVQILAQARQKVAEGWRCTRCGGQIDHYRRGGGICDDCDLILMIDAYHDEAIDVAQQICRQSFVIFDTETTGLHQAEIVQAAVIDQDGAVLFDSLVRPEHPNQLLERGDDGVCAADIHGLTPDQLVDAPPFPAIYPALHDALAGRTVIIYNADFDRGVLQSNCDAHNLPMPEMKEWVCAMKLYARYYGEWSRYWRDFRWQRLPGGDHSALGDCRATLALVKNLASSSKKRTWEGQVHVQNS